MTDKLLDIKVGDIFRRKSGFKPEKLEVIFVNEEVVLVKYLESKISHLAFTHESMQKWFKKVVPKPRYFMNLYRNNVTGHSWNGPLLESLEKAKTGIYTIDKYYVKTIEITDLINEE